MLAADDGAAPISPQHRKVVGEDTRPVLFLHIPKTAGTSFLLMLQNAFGDNNVRRLQTIDKNSQSAIDDMVEHELDKVSCLTGHLPLYLFEKHLERFQPFTVLREPISRVLSLFRFLKAGDPAELRRLELDPGCSLKEFLDSRHPEIYGQVNNGMVRLLCGSARMVDPNFPEFWDGAASVRAMHLALANLRHIDFGLTEEMGQTLRLAQVKWSIPYPLRQYRENTTIPDAAEEDAASLYEIITANAADLALYHWARTEFATRAQSLVDLAPGSAWNARSVLVPPVNTAVSIADIAGRQGFHEYESIGIAWLRSEQPARLQLVTRAGLVRLRLHLFCLIPAYPVSEINICIGNKRLRHDFLFVDDKWGWLETEFFAIPEGPNVLSIEAPVFIRATEIDPETQDERKLGVALADLMVEGL
jgi:hypothetical protein